MFYEDNIRVWNIHFFMTIRSRFSERYHGANSCLIRKILYFYDNLVQVIRFILYAGRLKHYRQFLFYFKENPKYIWRHDATFWTSVFVRLNQTLTDVASTLTLCPLRSLVCAAAPKISMSYYTSVFHGHAVTGHLLSIFSVSNTLHLYT